MGSKDIQYETPIDDGHLKQKLDPQTLGSRLYGPLKILGKNAAISIFLSRRFVSFTVFWIRILPRAIKSEPWGLET